MKKHPFYALLLFLLAASGGKVNAQAPGYLGKRCSFSYGIHLTPTISGNTSNGSYISAKHEGVFAFCLTDRWQMAVSAEIYNTIYNNALPVQGTYETPANFYNIKGKNFGLLFKKFKKGYVAPWGSYFMFGPQVNYYKTNYDNYMYFRSRVNNSYDTLISDFGPQTQTFLKGDFALGWGKSRIIKDRVIVDWGLMFRMRSLASAMGGSLAGLFWSLTNEEYIRRTAALRTNKLNSYDFYVKVGYLF